MKILSIILFCFLALTACDTNKVKMERVGDKFSIETPSYLKKTTELNEDASLQCANGFRELYMMVFDEQISELHDALQENELEELYSEDLEGYSNLLIDSYMQSIKNFKKTRTIDTTLHTLPAKLFSIKGEVEGVDVYYIVGCLKGKERYYQIVTWTLAEKEYEYKDIMKKMLYSFREIL
jgi:hypothetical protein